MTSRLYDISRPIHQRTPVWPGDEPFELAWTASLAAGDPVNVATVHLGVHLATHADAPLHVLAEGASASDLALAPFLGSALVIETGSARILDASFFRAVLGDRRPARLLVRTGAWASSDFFPTEFPPVSIDGVAELLDRGLALLGTDAPSVDPFGAEDLVAHRALLGAGIPILENLCLDDVPTGEYELIALPLRLVGADASPVRAVLRAE